MIVEAIEAVRATAVLYDETGGAKHPEMFREDTGGAAESSGDVPGCALTIAQEVEDAAPGGVRDGTKDIFIGEWSAHVWALWGYRPYLASLFS